MGLPLYLIQVKKIIFVETVKKCEILLTGMQEKQKSDVQIFVSVFSAKLDDNLKKVLKDIAVKEKLKFWSTVSSFVTLWQDI